jgi:hypothetical protein
LKRSLLGDEPIWVIIHFYREMSQGNSLYNYLKQTKLSYYFAFTKVQEGRTGPACGGGVDTSGRREEVGNGEGGQI